MENARSLTASEAKASLGEVLGSLVSEGPVRVTRNGRWVAVISAPPGAKPAPDASRLPALVVLYAAGQASWQHLADETGASFGEVLLELAKQGLQLPQASASKRPEQLAAFKSVLQRAAGG